MTTLRIPLILSILLSILGIQSAHGISAFSSSSSITFRIENITNNTNPGDLLGLSISGGFGIQDSTSVEGVGKVVVGSADSSYQFIGDYFDPADGSLGAFDRLTQTFSALGTATDGSVESYYQAVGSLQFANSSNFFGNGSSYTIDYSMEYEISSVVQGNFSSNEISLDYYSTQGYDYWSGTDIMADINESVKVSDFSGYGIRYFSVTLNPTDETYIFHADTAIRGKATTVAPVPILSAGWLLLSGLAFIRLYNKKNSGLESFA